MLWFLYLIFIHSIEFLCVIFFKIQARRIYSFSTQLDVLLSKWTFHPNGDIEVKRRYMHMYLFLNTGMMIWMLNKFIFVMVWNLILSFSLYPQNQLYFGNSSLVVKYVILTCLAFVFQATQLNIFFWFKNSLKSAMWFHWSYQKPIKTHYFKNNSHKTPYLWKAFILIKLELTKTF